MPAARGRAAVPGESAYRCARGALRAPAWQQSCGAATAAAAAAAWISARWYRQQQYKPWATARPAVRPTTRLAQPRPLPAQPATHPSIPTPPYPSGRSPASRLLVKLHRQQLRIQAQQLAGRAHRGPVASSAQALHGGWRAVRRRNCSLGGGSSDGLRNSSAALPLVAWRYVCTKCAAMTRTRMRR